MSDIDTVPEDSLKAFDFDRPIREATKHSRRSETSLRAICRHMQCSKKSVAIRPRSSSQLCLSLCSCIMRKTKAWFKNIALRTSSNKLSKNLSRLISMRIVRELLHVH